MFVPGSVPFSSNGPKQAYLSRKLQSNLLSAHEPSNGIQSGIAKTAEEDVNSKYVL